MGLPQDHPRQQHPLLRPSYQHPAHLGCRTGPGPPLQLQQLLLLVLQRVLLPLLAQLLGVTPATHVQRP